ncbi:MAG: NYN domain-containing protein [Candidatus Harrisonbacteria bacterium]|nr:NYN domain-containing protein [Candidatus Harrisonbacteria bacterium]
MQKEFKNYAYIDGANLHKGVESSMWKLDYRRFRSWIRQKFSVTEAYLFIGLMSKHADLYTSLQSTGYKLVFKEIVYDGSGKAKGNCDADLVLQAMKDYYEACPEAVLLVASDGDYASLVRFWQEKKIPCVIVSPAPIAKCSILLKRTGAPIIYLEDMKHKLLFRSPK